MKHDYQDIIKNEIAERCKRNPAYSMRAFASAAGMTPPHLSAVLNHQKGLSAASAMRVASALGLSREETSEFVDLVNSRHARRHALKETAKVRVETSRERKAFKLMDVEKFRLISDWHHFAILHLLELDEFEPSARWISKRIGLPEKLVKESLRLLTQLGYINMATQPWQLNQKFMATPDVPSRAIRNNHHQVLKLASTALEKQAIEDRDFSTVYMAIKKESVAEAKTWLKEFRRKFCRDLDREPEKNALYCLSTQFFELTEKEESK